MGNAGARQGEYNSVLPDRETSAALSFLSTGQNAENESETLRVRTRSDNDGKRSRAESRRQAASLGTQRATDGDAPDGRAPL